MVQAVILTVDIIKYWPIVIVPIAILTFVIPCRMRVRAQAYWIMFLLLCGVKGFAYETLGGNAMAPQLPQLILWAWNWAVDGMFFLTLISCFWWVKWGRAWILPVLAWGLALWGQVNGTVPPDVREIDLTFPNLPSGLEGYRIVQLSDLHCSSAARRWRTQSVVDRVNGCHPDLICLTGDYVDGKMAYLKDDLEPLKSLKAKDGVYCIRGNHEYYVDEFLWRRWFRVNGFRMLVNECVFPHEGLAVAGVNDIHASKHGDIGPDVGEAFAAATNGEFRVLMEHRPVNAPYNLDAHGVDLQLSGHTHGGVSWLVDWFVAQHNLGYVRGLYRMGGKALYVSSGCGQWVGFPMRFFVPAEITLITLRR